MYRYVVPFVVAGIVFSSVASAEYKENRTLTQKTGSIESFSIDVGAGDLVISTSKTVQEIQVEATIVVKGFNTSKGKKFAENNIRLELTTKGNRAYLVSDIDSESWSLFSRILGGTTNAYVDIEIVLPEHIALEIDDGSGDIEMRDIVQDVELEDGSGDIDIKYLTGRLEVDDGSGDLRIDTVKGTIDIEDGSGDTKVENAEGNISIDDGSGDIRFKGIIGSVEVEDGSGDIRISVVTGDVRVRESGSGDVYLSQVSGSVIR